MRDGARRPARTGDAARRPGAPRRAPRPGPGPGERLLSRIPPPEQRRRQQELRQEEEELLHQRTSTSIRFSYWSNSDTRAVIANVHVPAPVSSACEMT